MALWRALGGGGPDTLMMLVCIAGDPGRVFCNVVGSEPLVMSAGVALSMVQAGSLSYLCQC